MSHAGDIRVPVERTGEDDTVRLLQILHRSEVFIVRAVRDDVYMRFGSNGLNQLTIERRNDDVHLELGAKTSLELRERSSLLAQIHTGEEILLIPRATAHHRGFTVVM